MWSVDELQMFTSGFCWFSRLPITYAKTAKLAPSNTEALLLPTFFICIISRRTIRHSHSPVTFSWHKSLQPAHHLEHVKNFWTLKSHESEWLCNIWALRMRAFVKWSKFNDVMAMSFRKNFKKIAVSVFKFYYESCINRALGVNSNAIEEARKKLSVSRLSS